MAVLSIDEDSVSPGDLVVVSPVPGAFDGMAVEIKADKTSVAKPADGKPTVDKG